MSAKIMGLIWDLDLPHNEQSILLAYADHADHTGGNIFPSIGLIAWKTGYSEEGARAVKKKLIQKGVLVVEKKRPGKTDLLRIVLSAVPQKPPFNPTGEADETSEQPPQKLDPPRNLTPQVASGGAPPQKLGSTPQVASGGEPSIEPSIEPSQVLFAVDPADAPAASEKEEVKRLKAAHSEFIRLWSEAYQSTFGESYAFAGGKDAVAVKALLKASGLTPERLVAIAGQAWRARSDRRRFFHCGGSLSIAQFASRFNDIRIELKDAGLLAAGDIVSKEFAADIAELAKRGTVEQATKTTT